jgi:hypothetical protein
LPLVATIPLPLFVVERSGLISKVIGLIGMRSVWAIGLSSSPEGARHQRLVVHEAFSDAHGSASSVSPRPPRAAVTGRKSVTQSVTDTQEGAGNSRPDESRQ